MLINVCITRCLQIINYSVFVIRFSVLLARSCERLRCLSAFSDSFLASVRVFSLMTLRLFYDTIKPTFLMRAYCYVTPRSHWSRRHALMVIELFSLRNESRDLHGDRNAVCNMHDIIVHFRVALLTNRAKICGVKLNVIFHESAQVAKFINIVSDLSSLSNVT